MGGAALAAGRALVAGTSPSASVPVLLGEAAAGGAAGAAVVATLNAVMGKRPIPERAKPYVYAYMAGREISQHDGTADAIERSGHVKEGA